jgi:UDP-N-acetylmuramoylalanine--D-glutamate ligase
LTEYSGKKYAVLGLARAGIPVARLLASQGARVVGYDKAPLEKLSAEARALPEIGVQLRVGEDGFAGLDEFDGVVLSPGLKIHDEPLRSALAAAEKSGAQVLGELEFAARHCPAPMIAVTGTKGKSTTVKLITEMLRACGVDAVRAGNTGTPLTAALPQLSPQSWAVVEVSSFQLERAPSFHPRVGVLLNLLQDHQDYHPSFEQYWATKLKLFANQTAEDTAIFNADDPRVGRMLEERGTEYSARVWKTTGATQSGALGWWRGEEFVPVIARAELPLLGTHNASNAAAALAAVRAALGEAVFAHQDEIADALRNFQSLPHRLEIVAQKDGLTWVNDSQATIPDAAIGALRAFDGPIALIAGGHDKLNDPHGYDKLGAVIAERAHLLLTIGETAQLIESAALRASCHSDKIVSAHTLPEAVRQARARMPAGGTVVLSPACASFDQFQSFEQRGETFRALALADEAGKTQT